MERLIRIALSEDRKWANDTQMDTKVEPKESVESVWLIQKQLQR